MRTSLRGTRPRRHRRTATADGGAAARALSPRPGTGRRLYSPREAAAFVVAAFAPEETRGHDLAPRHRSVAVRQHEEPDHDEHEHSEADDHVRLLGYGRRVRTSPGDGRASLPAAYYERLGLGVFHPSRPAPRTAKRPAESGRAPTVSHSEVVLVHQSQGDDAGNPNDRQHDADPVRVPLAQGRPRQAAGDAAAETVGPAAAL